MALNVIWIFFFVSAFLIAIIRLVFFGDTEIFPNLIQSTYENAKTGFEISLGLVGVMTLWLGLMKIGEKGGMVAILSRIVGPFFRKLFPEIPPNHPVNGSIMMNFAANMLGLDNAATPIGLKAMGELQELNNNKDTASNSMIMFLVINTSGLTIIPISVMVYRAQMGAADSSDVFLPILLSTFFSTLAGIIAVSVYQKINLFNKIIVAYLGGLSLFVAGIIYFFTVIPQEKIAVYSSVMANVFLFSLIISFILLGLRRKIHIYNAFIEGAKEGFNVAITIIPFLIAILVAIGVFRVSGALDYVTNGVAWMVNAVGFNTDFVPALPTAFMKPLSGTGARGMMLETMNHYGVDSFAAKVACTMQGATDTTFYIIAVYFGSVAVKNTRYAVTVGLLADLVGILAAIFFSYLFFA
jgi:spore maturation protein SpmA